MTSPAIAPNQRPVFPSGVRVKFDTVRRIWVLLAPERAVKLDQTGTAILAEIDGKQDFSRIAQALAKKYDAPIEQITCDAARFLRTLADRKMIDLK